jgi:D-threo-aldose 1-dehydrogenase
MVDYRPYDAPTPPHRPIGFGCASLYGLPARRDRRAVLEFAYDLGIRHFDVAPMYGLGLAEAELSAFIRTRPDIHLATKFGIRPTAVGRFAGLVQRPIRRILQSSPAMKADIKTAGSGPEAGPIGQLLYIRQSYSVENARRALLSSLRALRTERIDYYLLHEPIGALADDHSALIDYLEAERGRGVIGRWGPAGRLSDMDSAVAQLSARASVIQLPYDLVAGHQGPQPDPGRPSITFGVIGAALPRVRQALGREPQLRQTCSELLDADLSETTTVVRLLVRDAVAHNPGGTVLVSSTKTAHLETACAAADVALPNEAEVADIIRQKCMTTRAA